MGLANSESRIAKVYSGGWGCAAVLKHQWLQWQGRHLACGWHIAPKELLPIVPVALVWGEKQRSCFLRQRSVVEVLKNGYSKGLVMMHMVRCLFFITKHHNMSLEAVHLPGKANVAADALSHNNLPLFLQVYPGVSLDPSPIPPQVLKVLVEEQPE